MDTAQCSVPCARQCLFKVCSHPSQPQGGLGPLFVSEVGVRIITRASPPPPLSYGLPVLIFLASLSPPPFPAFLSLCLSQLFSHALCFPSFPLCHARVHSLTDYLTHACTHARTLTNLHVLIFSFKASLYPQHLQSLGVKYHASVKKKRKIFKQYIFFECLRECTPKTPNGHF